MQEKQSQVHRDVHHLIDDFSKKMIEFTQIQAELMEFRIFASLEHDPEEIKKIIRVHKKDKEEEGKKSSKKQLKF
ncbi:hypothetical protein J4414_00515 [Candidatus Woesearchaeota archaeon]|nr:hypothetical protein [Candidatus Woesearchaeota archaeon]